MSDSTLQNPPRLVNPSADGGYDWREFDQYLQRLTAELNALKTRVAKLENP